MDAIRAAMRVPKIDYLGFSYGTYLGALYAEMYPTRVRSMVLDGAVDPAVPYAESTISQAVGFEHALDAFLAWCRDSSDCEFARGGDPRAAYDSLMKALAARIGSGEAARRATRARAPGKRASVSRTRSTPGATGGRTSATR